MARQAALPPTLPPRLIDREASAAYASVSPNTFDLLVTAGSMPKPRVIPGTRRLAWDVRELERDRRSASPRGRARDRR